MEEEVYHSLFALFHRTYCMKREIQKNISSTVLIKMQNRYYLMIVIGIITLTGEYMQITLNAAITRPTRLSTDWDVLQSSSESSFFFALMTVHGAHAVIPCRRLLLVTLTINVKRTDDPFKRYRCERFSVFFPYATGLVLTISPDIVLALR